MMGCAVLGCSGSSVVAHLRSNDARTLAFKRRSTPIAIRMRLSATECGDLIENVIVSARASAME